MKNKELLVNFPECLRVLPQWVMWKYIVRDGKETKAPFQVDGSPASSTDTSTWTTLDRCLTTEARFDGVGFVFTEGVVGIDLDKCFDEAGELNDVARATLAQVDSYTELSPSGKGLHIIVESDVLPQRKRDANKGVECYANGRFFTVTGNVFQGRDAMKPYDIMPWYRSIFGESKSVVAPAEIQTGYLPDDETILRVMFNSKGGIKLRELYDVGNWQSNGYGSQSEADLSLTGALMFYCRNNTTVVNRLFHRSKLIRKKWDEKHGNGTYGEKTMDLAYKSEVMEWKDPSVSASEEEPEYIMSGGKNPFPLLILENVCLALDSDVEFKSLYRLNDFSHSIEVRNGSTWYGLQDIDILNALRYISRKKYFLAKISKEMTVDAIRHVANKTKVNPPVDYLRDLVWDEVPRLDYWLREAFGVPTGELHEKMGANWMKGLVSRVLHPGCQYDQVLVLEGEQGWRKSSALRVLGAPWHVESTLSTEDTDFYMLLARNVIVEFSEGEIVGRTTARRLKAVITKTEDTYRAPYERGHQTYKRGCVFAMTTNDDDYQKDETGGRRWLPVVLTRMADTEWLKENRDQLYAEAVYRVEVLKETTYEYPQGELTGLQKEKFEYDEISEPIQKWYEGLAEEERAEGVLTLDAFNGVLNPVIGDAKEIPQQMTWRIGKVFKTVLGLTNKPLRVGGILKKRWFKA